jgi:hypothetical protein
VWAGLPLRPFAATIFFTRPSGATNLRASTLSFGSLTAPVFQQPVPVAEPAPLASAPPRDYRCSA